MEAHVPAADPNGPALPQGPVPPARPPPQIPIAPAASGAVQQPAAPPAKRSRTPRGPIPVAANTSSPGAPAMLELSAAYPMYTEQRRSPSVFVPDAQMLFHVLAICDHMMISTDRFIRSSPAWMPIVSQLYISVLWNVMILIVYVNSGYGSLFAQLLGTLIHDLQINECMIPGPLVPFFQSLGAVNGPFDWMGDIFPAMPDFHHIWNADNFHAAPSYARLVPIPAVILDQLHYFSQWAIPANQGIYTHFQWYRNVFQQGIGAYDRHNRIGPQTCGSIYATQPQIEAARTFWNSALNTGITRTNAAAGQVRFSTFPQLFGFLSQAGSIQLNWFQHVTTVMQKYTQYFNGSVPLKSILPVGIGAVVTYAKPPLTLEIRNWLYPSDNDIEPFTPSFFDPRREIPNALRLIFRHADHELEEQAEQYAILSHTNIIWSEIQTQNDWDAINDAVVHIGDYWHMTPYRFSGPISLKTQFAQVIASRYHQQAANRVE
nr:coat protein [Partitiviridae sp.]